MNGLIMLGEALTSRKVEIGDIEGFTDRISEELEEAGCPMKQILQFSVAIDEIYSNITYYAYPDTTGPATLRLYKSEDDSSFVLEFEDEGVPYDPLKKADPDVTLELEQREIGGLGIFMVKKLMDDMVYERRDNKNILRITKKPYNRGKTK